MFPNFVFPKAATLLTLAVVAALAGCGRKPAAPADQPKASPAQAEYATPPAALEVRAGQGGVTVTGSAPAGLQVRLATPQGQALFAQADAQGRWRIALPPSDTARIFGLSERVDGRQVQAEGYLVIGPKGEAALLRAGAGAVRLDGRPSPSLSAVDFDRDGATVVSGLGPRDSLVFLRIDGRQIAEARTDAQGRYAIALGQPEPKGVHSLEVAGDSFTSSGEAEISPAAPLVDGPLRSQFTKGGLRVDWMTPGGGVQSTVLLD